jgi:hypothetical protein
MNNLIYYIFAACSLLLLSHELTAQEPITFERYYSDSGAVEGKSIQQTFDGGYIVAGRRNGAGMFSNDAILMKTDSLGDVEWLKVYATNLSDDEFYDVKQTTDSGYIACGYYPQLGMGDNLYIVKTDINGDTLWTRVFGSNLYDIARSVAQTYDGGFVFAGQMDSTGIVVRLDAQGDTIWTKRLYDAGYVSLYSVAETSDSGFVTTGVINTFSGNQVYIACIDKNGVLLWEKNYGYGGSDLGQMIKVLNDGNYIVCGYTQSFDFGDMYLLKFNSFGDTLWTRVYRKSEANTAYSIDVLNDGAFIIGGTTNFAIQGNFTNLWLVKTDSMGVVEWEKAILGGTADYGGNAIKTRDNGYIICGMTNKNAPLIQLYLVKTDEFGSIVSTVLVENNQIDINIYPNPFREYINIDLSGFNSFEPYQIKIYNELGQPIQIQTVDGGTIHSISTLPTAPGLYFLQISNKGKILKTISLSHL